MCLVGLGRFMRIVLPIVVPLFIMVCSTHHLQYGLGLFCIKCNLTFTAIDCHRFRDLKDST